MKNRIFVDANVLIAGADSRTGAGNAVLQMAEIGLYRLVVSRQVLAETERNLREKLPRALPNFATQMSRLTLEIVPDPPPTETAKWVGIIEAKDAPILAAAVLAKVDRFLTLNTKDFTPEVAAQSGLLIQTPGELIVNIRAIVDTVL
jgi:predicted nucleic acid-binding protein